MGRFTLYPNKASQPSKTANIVQPEPVQSVIEVIKEVRVEVPVIHEKIVEKVIRIPVLEIREKIPSWAKWALLISVIETIAISALVL